MKIERALKLIEKAVDFYIRQNLEVPANLFALGYDQGGISEEAFKKREEMREAVKTVKRLLPSD